MDPQEYLTNGAEAYTLEKTFHCLKDFLSHQDHTHHGHYDARKVIFIDSIEHALHDLTPKMEDVAMHHIGQAEFDNAGGLNIYFGVSKRVHLEDDALYQRVCHDKNVADWRDVLKAIRDRLFNFKEQCLKLGASVDRNAHRQVHLLEDNLVVFDKYLAHC